ncbi:MAG: NAD-dependent succinate-semialdehyde dehydrogenase [Leptolyngbyaceae cyanobacterium]
MGIATVNPSTGETLQTFTALSSKAIASKLAIAQSAFEAHRRTSFEQRATWLHRAADILEQRAEEFGKLMSLEMGKLWTAGTAEARKCAMVCRYYADHGADFLRDRPAETDASQSFIAYQPLGIILAVMPWNFPFWQVFRFAAPALMAGNVGLLKHASNVPQCALAIEEIFREAGVPEGVFQTLLISASQVAEVVADDRVKAATLTGSEGAGASLAATAGAHLKKTVLELGGSDPFVVLASADLEAAAATAVQSRMLNSGQTCISAKRYIVQESVADAFTANIIDRFKALKIGNPLLPDTHIGPLSTRSICEELAQQVQDCIAAGAKVLVGGNPAELQLEPGLHPGNFYPPTLLVDIPTDSPVAQQELFGPVAMLFRVSDIDEAIALANDVPFGLGASAWTQEAEERDRLIRELDAGAVFINGLVKSDPRMPFGGIKRSGYGRELGMEGIHEFVNIKTVWVK